MDFNAAWSERGYAVLPATVEDLARHGFSPQQAIGRRFLLNGGSDGDEEGYLADILHVGTIVADVESGYLAALDVDSGFFWRRKGPRL